MEVLGCFCACLEMFGLIRTHSDTFGCNGMHSDMFGAVRTFLDFFKFFDQNIICIFSLYEGIYVLSFLCFFGSSWMFLCVFGDVRTHSDAFGPVSYTHLTLPTTPYV